VVILDFQMPDVDGEELGRRIKSDPLLADTELVMLTSMGLGGHEERLADIGFASYLVKPVRELDLMDALRAVWGTHLAGAPQAMVTRHQLVEARSVGRTGVQTPDAKKILHARRILVAEDNAVNQKVAVLLLAKLGCHADVAGDGVEAVRMFEAFPFDLVLMDVRMPEMNGFEATGAIRALEGDGRHTPIIAMTAGAMEGDRDACLAAGMDDYVTKPVRLDVLAEALTKWLAPTAGPEEGAAPVAPATATSPATPQGPDAPPPVDLARFRAEMAEADLLEESDDLIRTFLRTSPPRINALELAVAAKDLPGVAAETHALKSSIRLMEAHRLADQCESLEAAGRAEDLESIRAGMDAFLAEFGRVAAFLREVVGVDPPA
jgi:CheY-like chemotaxis protein/HPt (histidine-containing phosphotransfer) domain-containing protein